MKRFLLPLLALLLPLGAAAQVTTEDLSTDFRGRLSLGVDKKIVKGLHAEAEFESRFKDNFSRPSRLSGTLGLTYKVNPYLKLGLSYTFMESYKNKQEAWFPRHRLTLDVTGGYRAGAWRFSLRERLQVTHLTEPHNLYQEPTNPLYLKSRLKVSYKGFRRVEPYAYLDARLLLNAASVSATWSQSTQAFFYFDFLGYQDVYFNRLRGALGAQWDITKRHALDFYVLLDYCYDRDIDVTADLLSLKSITNRPAFHTTLGVGYQYKF